MVVNHEFEKFAGDPEVTRRAIKNFVILVF